VFLSYKLTLWPEYNVAETKIKPKRDKK